MGVGIPFFPPSNDSNPNDAYPVQLPYLTEATGRLKISTNNNVSESSWQYDLQPRTWSNRVAGSATVEAPGQKDPSYVKLSTTTASGDKAELRTKRFNLYQPFRTHKLTMSTILGTPKANLLQRFGQYTNFNGWYFERNGLDFFIGYRNNCFIQIGTEETLVERSNWNIDSLDGSGPSKINFSDAQIGNAITWIIEFVWHGTQIVRWGLVHNERVYYVHKLFYSGTQTKPFSRSALLPINFEMENLGAVGSNTIWYCGPTSFNVESGETPVGQRFSIANGVASKTVNSPTVPTYILAIRPKLQFNGINNRGTILPLSFEVFSDSPIYFEIFVQSVVANGTWLSADNISLAEYSTDFTTLSQVGYRVESGYLGAGRNSEAQLSSNFESKTFICIDTLSNNDQLALVVVARQYGNNAAQVAAAINWREVY